MLYRAPLEPLAASVPGPLQLPLRFLASSAYNPRVFRLCRLQLPINIFPKTITNLSRSNRGKSFLANYSKMAIKGPRTFCNTFWMILGTSKFWSKIGPVYLLIITKILHKIQENYGSILGTYYFCQSGTHKNSDIFEILS